MADFQTQAVRKLIRAAGLGNQRQSDQILQLVKGLFFQIDFYLLTGQKPGRFDTENIFGPAAYHGFLPDSDCRRQTDITLTHLLFK